MFSHLWRWCDVLVIHVSSLPHYCIPMTVGRLPWKCMKMLPQQRIHWMLLITIMAVFIYRRDEHFWGGSVFFVLFAKLKITTLCPSYFNIKTHQPCQFQTNLYYLYHIFNPSTNMITLPLMLAQPPRSNSGNSKRHSTLTGQVITTNPTSSGHVDASTCQLHSVYNIDSYAISESFWT